MTPFAAAAVAAAARYLMGAVCVSGSLIGVAMRHVQTAVMTDPACVDQAVLKKSKAKTSMGLADSAKYLASSPCVAVALLHPTHSTGNCH